MFCPECGKETRDDAAFCPQCGTKFNFKNNQEEFVPTEIAQRRMGDKFTDMLASKIGGRDVTTKVISKEDMLELIRIHFIEKTSSQEERDKIVKASSGGGFLFGAGSSLDSPDGNYSLSSYNVATRARSRINLLHPSESSYVMVVDRQSGTAYNYYAFSLGKFKDAVKAMM